MVSRVMTTEVSTSDLRKGLCAAICSTVLTADAATKTRLATELDALPFERMGDHALLAMARRYVPAERVTKLLELSPARYDVTEFYLCGTCRDQHVIEVEPSAWDRCPNCNALPEDDPS
jgi:hypothetical protein